MLAAVLMVLMAASAACYGVLAGARLSQSVPAATQAVRDFVAQDARDQAAIVKSSKTRQEAESRLAEYRAQRAKYVPVIRAAARAFDDALSGIEAPPTSSVPAPSGSGGGTGGSGAAASGAGSGSTGPSSPAPPSPAPAPGVR